MGQRTYYWIQLTNECGLLHGPFDTHRPSHVVQVILLVLAPKHHNDLIATYVIHRRDMQKSTITSYHILCNTDIALQPRHTLYQRRRMVVSHQLCLCTGYQCSHKRRSLGLLQDTYNNGFRFIHSTCNFAYHIHQGDTVFIGTSKNCYHFSTNRETRNNVNKFNIIPAFDTHAYVKIIDFF